MDMATQHPTPAMISRFCNAIGDIPSGRARTASSCVDAATVSCVSGARLRKVRTRGIMVTAQKIEMPNSVCRHPLVSMKCWITEGHRVPAM